MSYQDKCEALHKKYEALQNDYNKLITLYEMELSFRRGLSNGEGLATIVKGPKSTHCKEREARINLLEATQKNIHDLRMKKVALHQVLDLKRDELGEHYKDRELQGKITSLTFQIKKEEKYLGSLTSTVIDGKKIVLKNIRN